MRTLILLIALSTLAGCKTLNSTRNSVVGHYVEQTPERRGIFTRLIIDEDGSFRSETHIQIEDRWLIAVGFWKREDETIYLISDDPAPYPKELTIESGKLVCESESGQKISYKKYANKSVHTTRASARV